MLSQEQNRQIHVGFGMTKQVSQPEDYTKEELDLLDQENKIAERRQQLETKRREENDRIRLGKIQDYERMKKLAQGWRTEAGRETDKQKSAEKILWAEEAEATVRELAQELGFDQETESKARVKPVINTNVALGLIIGAFVVCAVLTKLVGNWTMTRYPNETTMMLIANAPLRIMLSFTVVFLSFLVSVLIVRLFLTPLYRLWHSRATSARSFQDVVNEAPSWAVLFSVLFSFFGVMYLFVSIFTSLFA